MRMQEGLRGAGVLVAAAALGVASLSGCTSQESSPITEHDKAAACLGNVEGRTISHVIDVPNEGFDVRVTYSTDYDVKAWRITDTKTLGIEIELIPDPEHPDTEVFVENLHADASIKSTLASINGMATDSFDDHLHAGDEPGFFVSPDDPYSEMFVIGGLNETLISGWSYANSSFGAGEIDQDRLTEDNLKEQGAYGQQISIVVDVLAGEPGAEYHSKNVFDDTLIIPLEGKQCPSDMATTTTAKP